MLQEQEESIEHSKLELQIISRKLLFVDDAGELEKQAATLKQLQRTLKVDVKCLAGSKEENLH